MKLLIGKKHFNKTKNDEVKKNRGRIFENKSGSLKANRGRLKAEHTAPVESLGPGELVNGIFDTNLNGWNYGSSWAWDRISVRDGPYGGNWGAAKCVDLVTPLSQDFGGWVEGTFEAWFSLPGESLITFEVTTYLRSEIVDVEIKNYDSIGGDFKFPGYTYSKFGRISMLEIKVTRLESPEFPEYWPYFAVSNVRVT